MGLQSSIIRDLAPTFVDLLGTHKYVASLTCKEWEKNLLTPEEIRCRKLHVKDFTSSVKMIMWALYNGYCIKPQQIARYGTLECLQWSLRRHTEDLPAGMKTIVYELAARGRDDSLEWLHSEWDFTTEIECRVAAHFGIINVVERAVKRTGDINHDLCVHAAMMDQLDFIKWATSNGFDWSRQCDYASISYEAMKIIEWLHENKRLVIPDWLVMESLVMGKCKVLKWMIAVKYPGVERFIPIAHEVEQAGLFIYA